MAVSVAGSMLITVASPCQSLSMLSALAFHPLTHSLIHSLTHLIDHSLTHCSNLTGTVGSTFLSKQQHCPLLVRVICHLVGMMFHLKNDCTEQFLTLTLSHWFINVLWEKRVFFIEKWWIRVEGWCTFGRPDLAISLTESLPLRACYRETAISQVLKIHSEIVLVGEMGLDWSPGGRVIIRYDHWETTWDCVTAFVILTAEKKSRGKKGWLKECLPSLCLWRKKYGDTRVVSKDVSWQQSGRKSWERDGHERKEHPKGVSARCLRPVQPRLSHFVAWRHLEKMQMSRKQRDWITV